MIEILYFEDCPHHAATVALARAAGAECGLEAEIREILVSNHAEAVCMKFLGSPTVRVNGIDIEPGARDRTEFALTCRLYGTSGVPPKSLLDAALQEVGRGSAPSQGGATNGNAKNRCEYGFEDAKAG